MKLVDVEYKGQKRVIACALFETPRGLLLLDPGPAVSLPTVEKRLHERGASWQDVDSLLLTHIHLDHAGATGSIVARNPKIRVFVHEFGAVHLKDPTRLLDSSRRLYGDAMGELWGEFLAVPPENLHALTGGERLSFDSVAFDVAYTPGHAKHHVSFFDAATGIAYVGDTAGIRISPSRVIWPAAPPPDIDLQIWPKSAQTILEWKPAQIMSTHFGVFQHPSEHFDRLFQVIAEWTALVRQSLAQNGNEIRGDDERAREFSAEIDARLRRQTTPEDASGYDGWAMTPFQSWYGLARYLRKQGSAGSPP